MGNLHEYAALDIDGRLEALSDLKDKVVLIVNVASGCGLTPQYDGLVRLYDEFRARGFEILAFPCNQFKGQEPGTEAEIKAFCTLEYGVEFRLFSKIDVNGPNRSPLYAWLTSEPVGASGPQAGEGHATGDVSWNFEKFLVDGSGRLRARFAPQVEPCAPEIKASIEDALTR